MSEQNVIKISREQEKEIINILIDSSLYLGMSLEERQNLLCYLVSAYFNLCRLKRVGPCTTAMQTGSAM